MLLVYQRTANDCVIATIAMALNCPYEHVLQAGLESGAFDPEQGCRSEQRILIALGRSNEFVNGRPVGDIACLHRPHAISAEYFRDMAWGRRAILTVPSLNIEGGRHSVYFDGRTVHDPNPEMKPRYTDFAQLMPLDMVLFQERG